jgi:hypothetical protein
MRTTRRISLMTISTSAAGGVGAFAQALVDETSPQAASTEGWCSAWARKG